MAKRAKDDVTDERAPRVSKAALDELMKSYGGPEDLTGPDGLLKELMGALINRAMKAELTHHLGYEDGETPPQGTRSVKGVADTSRAAA